MTKKSYIIVAITLLLGVGLGYILNSGPNEEHLHSEEGEMWTCSMHPQIQLSEPGACPICGMDLIPLVENKGSSNSIFMSEGEVLQNNIQVIEVGESNTQKVIRLDGKIKINENNAVVQSAHFAGRIEQWNVQYEGQLVKKGELLGTIYSPELISAQKELIEASKLKSTNPLLYNAARKKLMSWKISERQIDKIEKDHEIVETLSLFAENTGVVTQLKIAVGSYVKKGEQFIQQANLNSVWIELDAFERDLEWLKIGMQAELEIRTGSAKKYLGTISYIDPSLNPKSRTAKVRIILQNNGELKPEMFVTAHIEIENAMANVTAIPKSAVLWTGKRSVIYKEVKHNTFQMQEIEIGKELGAHYQVLRGLDKGDRIVKTGTFVVDAAAQLQGKPSMMNKPVKEKEMVMSTPMDSNNSSQSFYYNAVKALQMDHEDHVKRELQKLLDSLPVLKEKHPHLLHSTGDAFKQGFSDFSLSLFDLQKKNNAEVFLVKCPMGNGNKGAYWISDKAEVDNPYFGGEMKTCGSVLEEGVLTQSTDNTVEEVEFPNLHPLVVHFPIVLIILAFVIHLLSYFVSWDLHAINVWILAVGFISSLIAAYVLHPHAVDLTDNQLSILEEHELFSYITVVLSGIGIAFYWKTKEEQDSLNWKKIVVSVTLGLATLFISLAGHHGAQLTHIENVNTNNNHNH